MLRAVVFDLDATLVDHVGAATAGLATWLAERGVEAREDLVARWFALEEEHFARWRDGEISHDEQRRERLRAFLPLVGQEVGEPAALDQQFAGFLAEFRRHWRAFDDALAVLAVLREGGLLTAVLTNGVEELQTEKVARVGLRETVGPLFSADALGVAKPRTAAFIAVCERLEVLPDQVLYVGDDHEVDVLGARAAGLRAVLVDRTGSAPPHETCVVRSLTEVLDLPEVRAALR
ncbi:putative hydrolase of the HAD superfamily [Quadrisphaera granulorum]|uniref:Putative hydrolase of the HAD superfamily n=1 Tax=Quadrisphaera granulorum TaxID=317664 RepID=A0A316ACJ3_9ACTN|nr:HAD family hydrolase [Quadrisphaera granulorum]PWJ55516.1 putative hydrolase of the HAD superfamily [Quadrisphaera granulorum]SZE95580.1 putative hydrolase of the HAD superfamily [Quadrisphaera granulorum]